MFNWLFYEIPVSVGIILAMFFMVFSMASLIYTGQKVINLFRLNSVQWKLTPRETPLNLLPVLVIGLMTTILFIMVVMLINSG